MTTTPIQVSKDLSEVLSQINQKLDNLQKEVSESRTETKVAIAEVKGEIKALDQKLSGEIKSIDQRLKNVETSQKNQAWTLIGILATAVLGILAAGGKILFFPNL